MEIITGLKNVLLFRKKIKNYIFIYFIKEIKFNFLFIYFIEKIKLTFLQVLRISKFKLGSGPKIEGLHSTEGDVLR